MAVAIYTSLLTLDEAPSGTVTVYDAGTTTPRAIYTDTGLSVSATNPIPLDSSGRATQGIIYTAATAYKVVVKNSSGSTLYTRDNIDPGVPVGTGKLAIANGGTGADDAAEALSNLGGATAAELADVAADVASLAGAAASTEKTHLATGTTAQRTSSPEAGDVRHNTTTTKYESYISGGWDNFMLESANAAATADVTAETVAATFIRPDRLKHSQRVAKAWGRITWSGATPSIADSFNVSGITDQGTGDVTITFTEAMPSANYAAVVTGQLATGGNLALCIIVAQAAGSFRVEIRNTSNINFDPVAITFVVFGDYS